jgi:hypothetical protein
MASLSQGVGVQLAVSELLDEARASTGLTDFGDPWFIQPLDALVNFVNAESGLTAKDAPPVQLMVKMLVDRLRLVDFVKKNPKVHDEKLDVVGVIVGLPRGGSTLLHRLLCACPQITSAYCWETMEPTPLPGEEPGDPTPRIKSAQAILDDTFAHWPGLAAMHPMSTYAYEEESSFFTRAFMAIEYTFRFNVPSYLRWHRAQNQSRLYRELRLWYQALQYQDPTRRKLKWLLKSGQHLWCGGLSYLVEAFPHAKLLMTHRNPESAIASVSSMRNMCIRDSSTTFDPKQLGAEGIDLYRDGLREYVALRQKLPPDRFIDVQYRDLTADPATEYRRALTEMGLTVTASDENAGAEWIAANGRDTHPPHHYEPEDFGITKQELTNAFKFYSDMFLAKG